QRQRANPVGNRGGGDDGGRGPRRMPDQMHVPQIQVIEDGDEVGARRVGVVGGRAGAAVALPTGVDIDGPESVGVEPRIEAAELRSRVAESWNADERRAMALAAGPG